MSWNEIAAQIRTRHVAAIATKPDELHLEIGFGRGARDRIALIVRRHKASAIVTALVDFDHHLDLAAAAQFATSWNISLVSVGNRICVRALLDPQRIHDSLHGTARTALRMRYATCITLSADDTCAFAL